MEKLSIEIPLTKIQKENNLESPSMYVGFPILKEDVGEVLLGLNSLGFNAKAIVVPESFPEAKHKWDWLEFFKQALENELIQIC